LTVVIEDSQLRERLSRLLGGYGLIEARYEHCVQALGEEEITVTRSDLKEVDRVSDPSKALAFFSTYTFPATRHILFPAGEGWAVIVNNSKNGSDFSDYCMGWSRAVRSRALRVADRTSKVWTKGSLRVVMNYEARIVELYQGGAYPLRSITCANDGGRWVWHVSGDPLPVETGFSYHAKRVKDRFTRENLRSFLTSLPAPAVDPDTFLRCRSFSLVEETYRSAEWMGRILRAACTETELDNPAHGYYERGLGWMEHLEVQFPSAIADFEKALEIDPGYEERIRSHLERAYRLRRGG
jgi:hypothetical protein